MDGLYDGTSDGLCVGPWLLVVNSKVVVAKIVSDFVIESTVRLNGTISAWKMSSSLRINPTGSTAASKS